MLVMFSVQPSVACVLPGSVTTITITVDKVNQDPRPTPPYLPTLLFMFPLICVRSDPSMCDIWPETRVKTSPSLVIHWSPISCLETLSGLVHQTLQWGTCHFLHSQYLILTTATTELANYNIAACWLISNWQRSSWVVLNLLNKKRQISQPTLHSMLHVILRVRSWGCQ